MITNAKKPQQIQTGFSFAVKQIEDLHYVSEYHAWKLLTNPLTILCAIKNFALITGIITWLNFHQLIQILYAN